MPYNTEFEANVQGFLGRYAVSVAGGLTNNAHGGGSVQDALAAVGFVMGRRKFEVKRRAPELFAFFNVQAAARNTDKLPFSKSQVRITLGPDDLSGTCVPVYLIPYAGGRALGVQLPDQATDGRAEAWAVTATQNGCTVEISGSRSSPYASHTNVIDAQAVRRQSTINSRLNKLQQRFRSAAQSEYGRGPLPAQHDPDQNRVQFGHYLPNGVNPAHNFHGYQQHVGGVAGNLNAITLGANQTIKGGRVETGLTTHTRFRITPTAGTIALLQNPAAPPNALVVGHRINDLWTFYFQEYTSMNFEVREVKKFGPKLRLSNNWIMNGAARREFNAVVILSHGQLWPNTVTHDETFT